MSKHTPGPWYPFVDVEKGCLPGIDHPKGSLILYGYPGESCGIGGANHEERIANARLIAAAPDLLEACEAALEYMPSSMVQNWPPGFELKNNAIRKCRDAIAKARGQQ